MTLTNRSKIPAFLFLLMLLAASGFSQTVEKGNFQFNTTERTVSWVKVFEPEQQIDFETLTKYFKESGIIGNLNIESNSFRGEFEKRPIDIQKYGYKRGTTPMVLLDVEQFFDVFLEFKEGRYRVILTNLGYIDNGVLTDLLTTSLIGSTTTAKGNVENYNGDFSFTKKSEVRKSLSNMFEILDVFYSDMMTYKVSEPVKSDW